MSKKKIVLSSVALTLIILFALILKQRAFSYGYNTGKNYYYTFDTTYAKILDVRIEDNIVKLPELDSTYNTAFIRIHLQKNIFGYVLQPEIEMSSDKLYLRQCFEYGASGIRYLNVSGFVQNKIKKINLDYNKCSIGDGIYKLILYKNRDVKKEQILILSPHPDDAEIAAYGLYSSAKNVFIATITAGDAGKSKYERFFTADKEHYNLKAKLRVWNSITVPLLAGINPQNTINLGYFDGSLKSMYFNDTLTAMSKFIRTSDLTHFRSKNISNFLDTVKATSTWRSLVNDLKCIIKRKKPNIIITTYPAIDTHYDHKCTSLALFQAMKELNYKNAELWMYTNHYSEPDLYPVGDMWSIISLPPYFKSPGIYFNKIYSHTLLKNEQVDKLFALDAMNDLRHNTEWNTVGDLFQVLYKKIKDELLQQSNSYYRRSVRTNELFFVIGADQILDYKFDKAIIGKIEPQQTIIK